MKIIMGIIIIKMMILIGIIKEDLWEEIDNSGDHEEDLVFHGDDNLDRDYHHDNFGQFDNPDDEPGYMLDA